VKRNTIVLAAIAFSILFIVLITLAVEFPGRWAVKALPIWLLAYECLRSAQTRLGKTVGVGLLLGSVGDVLLDIDPAELFVFGLGAFLLSHLAYIIAMLYRIKKPSLTHIGAIVLLCIIAGEILWHLYPKLGELLIPVAVYVLVIATMASVAMVRYRNGNALLLLGALVFMASDTLIAINKFDFNGQLEWAGRFIMATYYLAQFLICFGALETERQWREEVASSTH
jgi:uncharacterized membrane protein YhhN